MRQAPAKSVARTRWVRGCIMISLAQAHWGRRDVFWDDLVRRWRRDVRGLDPRHLRTAAGHVAVLPALRPRRRSRLPWLIAIAVGIGLIAWLLQSGQGQALVATVMS